MAKIVRADSLFSSSGRRVLSDAELQADPALIAEGWERRFTADPPRAEEAIELYSKLGYEVRAEPLRSDEMTQDCEECRQLAALQFKTIYTRRLKK